MPQMAPRWPARLHRRQGLVVTSHGEPNAGEPEPARMGRAGLVKQHEARMAELDGQLGYATDGATMVNRAAQEAGAGGDEQWRTARRRECRRSRAIEDGS